MKENTFQAEANELVALKGEYPKFTLHKMTKNEELRAKVKENADLIRNRHLKLAYGTFASLFKAAPDVYTRENLTTGELSHCFYVGKLSIYISRAGLTYTLNDSFVKNSAGGIFFASPTTSMQDSFTDATKVYDRLRPTVEANNFITSRDLGPDTAIQIQKPTFDNPYVLLTRSNQPQLARLSPDLAINGILLRPNSTNAANNHGSVEFLTSRIQPQVSPRG